jgi:hypothetical protein
VYDVDVGTPPDAGPGWWQTDSIALLDGDGGTIPFTTLDDPYPYDPFPLRLFEPQAPLTPGETYVVRFAESCSDADSGAHSLTNNWKVIAGPTAPLPQSAGTIAYVAPNLKYAPSAEIIPYLPLTAFYITDPTNPASKIGGFYGPTRSYGSPDLLPGTILDFSPDLRG